MNSRIKVIGLMSGTSFDGIDVSLIETDGKRIYQYLGDSFYDYPADLKKVYQQSAQFNIERLLEFEREISIHHCLAVKNFCKIFDITLSDIDLIGFHGQTLYHNPAKKLTLQVGNANMLAHQLGVDVISDFRRRDIESGGQGAPLVPYYHKAIIGDQYLPAAIVNIGGISNVTLISKEKLVAFDSGPGNAMLDDLVCYFMEDLSYDKDGEVSALGKVNQGLLNSFLADDYFKKQSAKSLDRNHFSLQPFIDIGLEDGAATIVECIASSIANSIPSEYLRIYVCGGGRKNKTIMNRLAKLSNRPEVVDIDMQGLNGDYIESQAFAYLAARIKYNLPISDKNTTGCVTQHSGGAFYRF